MMSKILQRWEKRKHPRVLVGLPLHIRMNKKEGSYPGLTLEASESGLLIQTLKEMPVGIRIEIEVSFSMEAKLSSFKAEAEVIWKDASNWDDWEGYQYGLKFTQISEVDHPKLKQILCNPTSIQKGS